MDLGDLWTNHKGLIITAVVVVGLLALHAGMSASTAPVANSGDEALGVGPAATIDPNAAAIQEDQIAANAENVQTIAGLIANNTNTAASLTASVTQTAAERDAALAQTAAEEDVTNEQTSAGVSIAQTASAAQVTAAQITANATTNIAALNAQQVAAQTAAQRQGTTNNLIESIGKDVAGAAAIFAFL